MRTIIKDKLEQIDALFTPERVAKSQERWRRLWAGEAPLDRFPFVYAPLMLPYYAAGFTPEARLQASLDEFIARGHGEDDFIPALFTGCKQSTIPNMFGAVDKCVDGDYTCDKILVELEDIDRLSAPSIGPGTVAREWLAMERYFIEETEGRLPVHVCDMQGPADVCGQLWGYDNLLTAAYTDPEYYHALMTKVTDAFILLWDAQRDICGDLFVGTHLYGWDWVPDDAGASLSADSLVMISADFYAEYYQPYLEKMSAHFGGLSVHSCGNFRAVAQPLSHTPGVKAINASQMSVTDLLDAGVAPHTIIIAFADIATLPDSFTLARERNLRLDLSVYGFWPVYADGTPKPYDAWAADDYAEMRRKEERVLEASDCRSGIISS